MPSWQISRCQGRSRVQAVPWFFLNPKWAMTAWQETHESLNVSRAWGWCEFFFPPWNLDGKIPAPFSGAQRMPRHWAWDRFPFWRVVARQVTLIPRNCKVQRWEDSWYVAAFCADINRSQRKIQSNKHPQILCMAAWNVKKGRWGETNFRYPSGKQDALHHVLFSYNFNPGLTTL